VVSLFHRLALEVHWLSFRPVPKANVYTLRIVLLLDPSSLSRIEAQLLKLVEVQSVRAWQARSSKAEKPEVDEQTMH
jgi:hypothetical protein